MKLLGWLYLAVVAAIVMMANLNQLWLLAWVHRVPMGDKVMHFLLLGGVCVAVNALLQRRTLDVWGKPILLGTLIVLVVATCEEFSQAWIPSRTFGWSDMAANWLGILCADRLLAWQEKRARAQAETQDAHAAL